MVDSITYQKENDSYRFIAYRAMDTGDQEDYKFELDGMPIPLIWAENTKSSELAYHESRDQARPEGADATKMETLYLTFERPPMEENRGGDEMMGEGE